VQDPHPSAEEKSLGEVRSSVLGLGDEGRVQTGMPRNISRMFVLGLDAADLILIEKWSEEGVLSERGLE
jgi:hypothetical protein